MNDRIKMVALDLDGTSLNSNKRFSERTIAAFHKAMEEGVHIVVATGRVFDSLPKQIHEIDGLEYVITSNGARTIRLADRALVYENNIPEDVVDQVISLVENKGYSVDAFHGGSAFIDSLEYEDMKINGSDFRETDYVLSTRNPVEGIFDFMREHRDHMENINIVFRDLAEKERMGEKLRAIENATITSSFGNNYEVGGPSTSKADALEHLMAQLGIEAGQLMAIGDSPNDLEMIRLAGIGIVVANASDEMKEQADYVTASNDDDGVALAIEKFVL